MWSFRIWQDEGLSEYVRGFKPIVVQAINGYQEDSPIGKNLDYKTVVFFFFLNQRGAKRRKRGPRSTGQRACEARKFVDPSPHSPSPFLYSLQTLRSNIDCVALFSSILTYQLLITINHWLDISFVFIPYRKYKKKTKWRVILNILLRLGVQLSRRGHMTVQDLGHSRNHNHTNTDICRLLFCGTSAAVQFTRGFSLDPPQRSNEYACMLKSRACPAV